MKTLEEKFNYLKRMLADADSTDFGNKAAPAYTDDALAAGELTWWEPYAEIHARNIETIKNLNA